MKSQAIYLCTNMYAPWDVVYDEKTRQDLNSLINIHPSPFTPDDIRSNTGDFHDVRFIFTKWGMTAFSDEEIGLFFPNLEAVFYASGSVKGFAGEFLTRGIRVFSAAAANAVPVAEYTFGQIILGAKGFFHSAGHFDEHSFSHYNKLCRSLPGLYNISIGVIGAGMIGSLVIEKLKTLHVSVLVYDPFLSDERAISLNVRKCGLHELFSSCEIITNHLADNEHTKGILGYDCFSLMSKTGVFINTGRGAQVVEDDLVRALREQPMRIALLDVTEPEPPLTGHPFYTMPNVFLSPHIAGSFGNEVSRMGRYMLEDFKRLISGEPTHYEVTAEQLEFMA